MPLLFLDATGNYSEPVKTKYKYLDANGNWTRPGASKLKYLDATGNWSVPVIGTLAADLPVGKPGNDTLVKFLTFLGAPVVWRVIGHNLSGMPDGSLTLLTDKLVARVAFDADESKERWTINKSTCDCTYAESNIRQWMNSEAELGKWYSSQHEYDEPPKLGNLYYGHNPYEEWAGFLNGQPENEKTILISTERHVYHYYKKSQTCIDKIFLLTSTEYGLRTWDGDGVHIPYFSNDESRIAKATDICASNFQSGDPSMECMYWTATCNYSLDNAGTIAGDGTERSDNRGDEGNVGFRPACNIPDHAAFSLEPDDDGCYTLMA